MATENFLPLFHDYVPFNTPALVYSVPSGYQAMVTQIRQVNDSAATTIGVSLYQGSGVARRLLQKNLQVDPEGLVIDDGGIPVSSGFPLFAAANVASGVALYIAGIISPA